ncbi:MAG: 50S ribosomal protein L23 [Patescibacteria group bacterium]
MAIFKKTKKEKEASVPKSADTSSARSYAHVLLSPRVTEKATDLSAHNAYVFNVDPRSGKKEIAEAVKAVYNVSPVSIATMRTPGKKTNVRGRKGKTASGKKAIVYIKKGEKIEVV